MFGLNINFLFLFQNANCSSGATFYLGWIKILRKNKKKQKKNKINYFIFIIIIDPCVQDGMWIVGICMLQCR
jgi:hypothetical protein